MPVGTRGAVRHLSAGISRCSVPRCVGQHLPPDVAPGRRHRSPRSVACTASPTGSGHILTDSGGYQIFSLAPEGRRRRRGVQFGVRRQRAPPHARGRSRRATRARCRHPDGARRVPAGARPTGRDAHRSRSHGVVGAARPRAIPRERRGARWRASRSSASCRAASTSRCDARARRARSTSASTAMPSAGCRWARPATRCCPRWRRSPRCCPPISPATSWASATRSAWSRWWPWASTCSTAFLPTRLARHGTLLTSAGRAQHQTGRVRPSTTARSTRPWCGQPRCPLFAGLSPSLAVGRRAHRRAPPHAAQLGLGLRFRGPDARGNRRGPFRGVPTRGPRGVG